MFLTTRSLLCLYYTRMYMHINFWAQGRHDIFIGCQQFLALTLINSWWSQWWAQRTLNLRDVGVKDVFFKKFWSKVNFKTRWNKRYSFKISAIITHAWLHKNIEKSLHHDEPLLQGKQWRSETRENYNNFDLKKHRGYNKIQKAACE